MRKVDEITKRGTYERFGVAEYWIVDPVRDTVKVHRRAGERFERAGEHALETHDTFTTPVLPGLAIALVDVFKE